jgi:hypothetical protein
LPAASKKQERPVPGSSAPFLAPREDLQESGYWPEEEGAVAQAREQAVALFGGQAAWQRREWAAAAELNAPAKMPTDSLQHFPRPAVGSQPHAMS